MRISCRLRSVSADKRSKSAGWSPAKMRASSETGRAALSLKRMRPGEGSATAIAPPTRALNADPRQAHALEARGGGVPLAAGMEVCRAAIVVADEGELAEGRAASSAAPFTLDSSLFSSVSSLTLSSATNRSDSSRRSEATSLRAACSSALSEPVASSECEPDSETGGEETAGDRSERAIVGGAADKAASVSDVRRDNEYLAGGSMR
eukprot:scaffold189005_cov30-Tisochrysis_lutea.AAC.6